MIHLAATVYDLDGHVTLHGDVNPGDVSRRVSRTALLDCTVDVNDGGYCPGDRTITVDLTGETRETWQLVETLVKSYQNLVASTDDGCFVVAPERINRTQLTLLVIEEA